MQLLLISSSNVHGYGYLDHPEPEIRKIAGSRKSVAFVPFAAADHDGYTAKVRERFAAMELDVSQVRDARDIELADVLFVGGGNTFRLLKTLYERRLLDPIHERVRAGMPYIGSSAGSNIAAPTIRTTNDMPIVEPPSFNSLGFITFQVNPHYLDADPDSKHKGETREERLLEFLEENDTPVVALREASALRIDEDLITLTGDAAARIFRRGQAPEEVAPGSVIKV